MLQSFSLLLILKAAALLLDFHGSRSQIQSSDFLLGKWIFIRWFLIAFLTHKLDDPLMFTISCIPCRTHI